MARTPFVAADIGPKYDVGFQTRDASSLLVKDSRGQSITMSSCAFVCSPKVEQTEETELDHKNLLTRLSSNNVMDREFDQWVQATQGDWSGGALQRVYTDTTRYWDGNGILWPNTDFQPQIPFAPAMPAKPANMANLGDKLAGGYLNQIGNGYAFIAQESATASPRIGFQGFAGGGVLTTATSAFAVNETVLDITMGLGSIYILTVTGVATATIYRIDYSSGLIRTAIQTVYNDGTANATAGVLAVGITGNKAYAACSLAYTNAGGYNQKLYIVDITTTGAPAMTSYTLPAAVNIVANIVVNNLTFQADSLILTISDHQTTYIVSSTLAGVFSTLATVPGTNAYICSVGGQLFIISTTLEKAFNDNNQTVEYYTLSGGVLSYIGPMVTPVQWGFPSKPVAFENYAIWTVAYTGVGVSGNSYTVFAYDVLRGRLFSVYTATNLTGAPVPSVAAFAAVKSTTPANFYAPWGMAVGAGAFSGQASIAQELFVGISSSVNSFRLRQGFKAVSSLIDFTQSQTNKLYRQIVVTHDPVISGTTVVISAVFDKDPGAFVLSNPYTVTHTYSAQDPDPTHTVLLLNVMAKKIVYTLTTTNSGGYNAGFIAAPTVYSVAVQATTGWVWTMTLDLTPNVLNNSKAPNAYVFQDQGVDHVAAYNFLKQLWRQKGGQMTVFLANGDSYSGLIQRLISKSPKPFGASFRSDIQGSLQNLIECKFREDL